MKKIILTIAMLLGITISSNANDINMAKYAMTRLNDISVKSNISLNDSTGRFYDMKLNDHIRSIKKNFLLDDVQEQMIYDVQNGVEKAFDRLNGMNDTTAKRDYMDNIVRYWQSHARMSFYATERTDAEKLFRRYWTCVNVTLRNKGYVDDLGNYVIR